MGCFQALCRLTQKNLFSPASLPYPGSTATTYGLLLYPINKRDKRGVGMMLLAVRNLSKSYGAIHVLNAIAFVINDGDRVGIVGSNGVGKSTLLKILVGQEEGDEGTFSFAPSVEVGYLPQPASELYGQTMQDFIVESVCSIRKLEERMRQIEGLMTTANEEQTATLLEEYGHISTRFQDRGGYDLDYKIDTILDGLHISYLPRTQQVQTLSGGEKARVGLATLLLSSPDLLLLDEPTNHLDFVSMEWLETYLSHYHGATMMVSHDRQFLNRAVNHVFEIDEHDHHMKKYEGNYDTYTLAKAAERVKWEEDYERQQEEIKELRKRVRETARQVGHTFRAPRDNDKFARYFFAQRVDSTVSRNVRAAEEQLKRIEADPIPKPPELMRVSSHFQTEPLQSRIVISATDITKSWGARCILRNLKFTVAPDARIVLIGPNGTGKTTLLKLLMGLETPDSGEA